MKNQKLLEGNYKFLFGIAGLAVLWIWGGTAIAEVSSPPDPDVSAMVSQLLNSMQSLNGAAVQSPAADQPSTVETARVSFSKGHLRMLGAPRNHYFPVSEVVTGNPTATAKNFIAENGVAFGVKSNAVDFSSKKSKTRNGRSYERFQQTYSQVPVFGAEVTMQLNSSGGMEYITSDIMRETTSLDEGKVSTDPTISIDDAEFLAIEQMSDKHLGIQLETMDSQLMIYAPEVVGNSGSTRLVWHIVVVSVSVPTVNEVILIDAHTGRVALQYTQIMDARFRQVYDSANTAADPGTLRRSEGGPTTGIADVDDCYDFLGDTYDFYFNQHGRDSIDNAGMTLSATVRICPYYPDSCPYSNAFWTGSRMYFGEGWASDDVMGHELTHGVTQYESGLIYQNESGAINESFSDMWGEWIDLTNGSGNDSPSVRWLTGEDLPIGAIRDMADPPAFGDPDRRTSPLWYTGAGDNGGVHTNSGVGNKLCYLLTDGDTFNGQTITGMGITVVADLFYEVQTNLLTSGSDYADLHNSLTQAAINLGWSVTDRDNLENACLATELSYIPPRPSNDECVDAICIEDGVPVDGTTLGATGTDITSCTSGDGADVWYSYTPALSGNVTVSLCGSDYDTSLAVFNACGGSELACNDDYCGLQSQVMLTMTAGNTYLVRVSGFGGATGTFVLTVTGGQGSCGPRPPAAQNGSASVGTDTASPITLVATDDGLPNPPGAMTYIIASLPSHGELSDPGNGVINSVPYSLISFGNQVIYTPDVSFTGSDSFQFKTNDGGTPPDGGDSNIATLAVQTDDCTPPPPVDPEPSDGTVEIPINPLLQWNTDAPQGGVIENFEDGDMAEYTILGGLHVVNTAAVHDGSLGLECDDSQWAYRNDPQVLTSQGDTLSFWVCVRSNGRAYCGFGASSEGTYSIVAAPNTNELLLQRNSDFSFTDIGSASHVWQLNKWYQMEVQWEVGGIMTGRLYDSDGSTLLNTVTASDSTFTSGGIAFRSFGDVSNFFDTVSLSGAGHHGRPSNLGVFQPRNPADAIGWDEENASYIFPETDSLTVVEAAQDTQLFYDAPFAISNVAIFQDRNPWNDTKNQNVLTANGISYTIYDSTSMGTVNLSPYDKVIISSDQTTRFYNALQANRTWFENYVQAGGSLDIHIATQGHEPVLPGGFQINFSPSDAVSIVDAAHPIVTTPNVITDTDLDHWDWSVHAYISTVPAGAQEILEVTGTGRPCAMELNFGQGRIFVTTQTVEWRGASYNYLENTILYGTDSVTTTYDVYIGTDVVQMELVATDLEEPVFTPCILDYETTYYWQVIAKNDCGLAAGPIWSFTTQAWQPLPEDGAMEVPLDTMLNWNGPVSNCDGTCGIGNGGFESGDFTPWVTVTGPGQEFYPWDVMENYFPFEGSYHAIGGFDGEAGLFYDLYQEVEIPSCASIAIFTWSDLLYWFPAGGNLPREYTVSVQPAGGGEPLAVLYTQQIQPGTFNYDLSYVTHSMDLLDLAPSIAGQTVRINFHQDMPESFVGGAWLYLDGISLTCGGEVLINTPQSIDQGTIFEAAEDPSLKEASPPESQLEAVIASQGGPDAGGYYYFDNREPGGPDFDWFEIAGSGTNLGLSDDSYYYPINLPFSFDFYGANYSQVAVDSNGGVYFEGGDWLLFINSCIPGINDFGVDRFIALYWDDLYPSGSDNVYAEIVGSAPNRKLIVQWQNVRHFSSSSRVTAQVQLYENGDILLLYADPSSIAGNYATVGIQNDSTTGLQYLCNQSNLTTGLAVLFTRNPDSPDEEIPITYDVYFGMDKSQMDLIGTELYTPECDPTPRPEELLLKGRVYYWQVVAKNTCGEVVSPLWSFATENTPPVADAGSDQTVFCWIDGVVNVTLNGSGSYDEDENLITYLWTWTADGQSYSEAGVSPTISLPAGVHTLTLVVNDGIDDSEPEEVVITAEPPVEISVKCTPKSLNCESNGKWIKAHFILPESYQIADVNTIAPCTLEPLSLLAKQIDPFINEDGLVQIDAAFDRDELCETDPLLGFNQMMPTGHLTSGHYFYGIDEIRILDNRMEHLINLGMNWLSADCIKPNWCDGMDMNTDGVVDLRDFGLIE